MTTEPESFASGYLPGLKMDDPVGSAGNVAVMGNHHDGHLSLAVERLNQAEKLIDMLGVETLPV